MPRVHLYSGEVEVCSVEETKHTDCIDEFAVLTTSDKYIYLSEILNTFFFSNKTYIRRIKVGEKNMKCKYTVL